MLRPAHLVLRALRVVSAFVGPGRGAASAVVGIACDVDKDTQTVDKNKQTADIDKPTSNQAKRQLTDYEQ